MRANAVRGDLKCRGSDMRRYVCSASMKCAAKASKMGRGSKGALRRCKQTRYNRRRSIISSVASAHQCNRNKLAWRRGM